MKYCTSCGSELPVFARFCGICGNLVSTTSDTPTGISDFNIVGVMHSDAPTFISDPSHPAVANDQLNRLDVTIRRTPAENEEIQFARSTEEHDAVMFDPLIWGAQPGYVPAPGGNIPVVHGTPYIQGVPVVQGTPAVPGAPAGQGLYQGAPSPAAPQVSPLAQHPLSNQPLTGHYPPDHPQLPSILIHNILGISIIQQERIQHITGMHRINLPIICTEQSLTPSKRSGIFATSPSLRLGK